MFMPTVYRSTLSNTETVFIVMGFNFPPNGIYHKLRQNDKFRWLSFLICRNLWLEEFVRVETQLLRLMPKLPGGTSRNFDIVFGSFPEGLLDTVFYHYNSYAYMGKNSNSCLHVNVNSHKYTDHLVRVIGLNLPRHCLNDRLQETHKLRR